MSSGYETICCFRSETSRAQGVRVLVEVTERCNQNCPHCHTVTRSTVSDQLTVADYRQLFVEGVQLGWKDVIVSGGEPLIRQDIFTILRSALDQGLNCDLCTNAVLIDQHTATELAGLLSEVSVSIEGASFQHDQIRGLGAFQRSAAGIDNLVRTGVEVHLITCVTSPDPDVVVNAVRYAREAGVHSLSLLGMMRLGKAEQMSQSYLDHGKQVLNAALKAADDKVIVNCKRLIFNPPLGSCPAGLGVLGVSAQGELRPCILIPGWRNADVRDGLAEAIRQLELDKFRSFIQSRVDRPQCKVDGCGQGCPAEPWHSDRQLGCDPSCPMIRNNTCV